MAGSDIVFNIAKGAVAEKVRDNPNSVGMLLLKAVEADGALADHDDLAALLGAAGNTEADFTNYARKTGLTGSVSVDDGNDRTDVDLPDQEFANAGGATNNSLVKVVIYLDEGGTEATRIPLTAYDITKTTDGNTFNIVINSAGFYRARAA